MIDSTELPHDEAFYAAEASPINGETVRRSDAAVVAVEMVGSRCLPRRQYMTTPPLRDADTTAYPSAAGRQHSSARIAVRRCGPSQSYPGNTRAQLVHRCCSSGANDFRASRKHHPSCPICGCSTPATPAKRRKRVSVGKAIPTKYTTVHSKTAQQFVEWSSRCLQC